jgi:hypothetical protein
VVRCGSQQLKSRGKSITPLHVAMTSSVVRLTYPRMMRTRKRRAVANSNQITSGQGHSLQ